MMNSIKDMNIDAVNILYDENGVPNYLEATRNEAVHIRELLQAEDENRLFKLPCLVGETVYTLLHNGIYAETTIVKCTIDEFSIDKNNNVFAVLTAWVMQLPFHRFQAINIEELGKTLFYTKEDAEKALEVLRRQPSCTTCDYVENTDRGLYCHYFNGVTNGYNDWCYHYQRSALCDYQEGEFNNAEEKT